ncbi:MAG: hydrogenase maturation protease [Acidimicrobiia bacterium]|nr:hydrogenase maturation protease [Acidimicrobiia bacterium]
MQAFLVIGYGNELRGDDGAGRVVADRIEAMALEGVTVRSVTQLVPELALDLVATDRVLFVDADVTVSEPVLRRLDGCHSDDTDPGALTHHVTPEVLVGLTVALEAQAPDVVELLSLPAASLELGSPLSPATVRAVDRGVALIVEHISAARQGETTKR